MSATYEVIVDLKTRGNLDAALGKGVDGARNLENAVGKGAGGSFDALGSKVASFASTAANAFTGVVEKAVSMAATLGKVGAVAAAGAIGYGLAGINNEVEKTTISLAAIFGANGITKDMGEGMNVAADAMKAMRKDAAALPGETRDLVGIFKDISVPGFQAGASIDQLRKLSASAMATSAVMGLPMEQAGREMAMLLEGRAGAHNVFGMRLAGLGGDKAEAFNKMSAGDRFKELSASLDKFAPSIAAFSHSWEGLTSTFKDNVRRLLGEATLPLFNRIKDTFEKGNDWLDKNSAKLDYMAEVVGNKLVAGFDWAKAKIEEWWPTLKTFAANARDELESIFDKVKPWLGKFEDKAKSFFGDPGSIDKVEGVLKMYAALKIGGPLLSGASSVASAAGALGGGEGAAGAVGALTGSLPILIPLLIAAGGAIDNMTNSTAAFHDYSISAFDDIKESSTHTWTNLKEIWTALGPVADLMGYAAVEACNGLSYALEGLTSAFAFATTNLKNFIDGIFDTGKSLGAERGGIGGNPALFGEFLKAEQIAAKKTVVMFDDEWKFHDGRDKKKTATGAGGGGGGAHITVNMTINQNDDPARVARHAVSYIAELNRNPTASRFAPNFSASRTP